MSAPVRIAAILAGLALTQGCAAVANADAAAPGAAPPASAVGASPAPTRATSPKGTDQAILQGRRQVYIRIMQDPDGTLAVDRKGRVNLSDRYGNRALFVLVPDGKTFLIKTGKIVKGGEPLCLSTKHNGAAPLTIVTKACDAGDPWQQFTVERQASDPSGQPVYAISNSGAYLQWFRYGRHGLIAQEIGDDTLDTTFTFTDRGPATLPILD